MKTINNFIDEKLKISSKSNMYTCQPKNKYELREILEERLTKDKNADLNDIDISQIKDMGFKGFKDDKGLFEELDPHNIDISKWDVSNVSDMRGMFCDCHNFNSNLSNWNVSRVENMKMMFYRCHKFNCDLGKWDVSYVEDMGSMFYQCYEFTGKGLKKWKVYCQPRISAMFDKCTSLKNIPDWYYEDE